MPGKIIEIGGTHYDLSTTDKDLLLDLNLQLADDIAKIASQLETAKAKQYEGDPIDRDWERRANNAKRHKGMLAQAIQVELAKRRHEEHGTFEQAFIAEARKRLPPDEFATLVREAKNQTPE